MQGEPLRCLTSWTPPLVLVGQNLRPPSSEEQFKLAPGAMSWAGMAFNTDGRASASKRTTQTARVAKNRLNTNFILGSPIIRKKQQSRPSMILGGRKRSAEAVCGI